MSHKRSSQLQGEQHPQQDWSELSVGEDVNVRYPDGHVEKAKIDTKSPDSRIIWLLTYAGQGRKMHGDWEGVCLSPSAREQGLK
jgi:hypothetical protein